MTGIPASWDSCTASAVAKARVPHAVWSSCGQYIAAGFGGTIELRDSNTLERVTILKPPGHLEDYRADSLTFSSDGCIVACAYRR